MNRKRIKALMLIVVAGAMLAFEVAGLWGALSVSRRALRRDHRRIGFVAATRATPVAGMTTCRVYRLVRQAPASVAAALEGVLL